MVKFIVHDARRKVATHASDNFVIIPVITFDHFLLLPNRITTRVFHFNIRQFSPAFTGSKMRHMFELVDECAHDVASHFLGRSESEPKISIEMKDVGSRYCNDVIATCAFGLKIDSFLDSDNEFYTNGKKLMDFTSMKRMINTIIIMQFPKIAKAFNIQFSDQTVTTIFHLSTGYD